MKRRKLEDQFDMGYAEGRATIVTRNICTKCANNKGGYCSYFKKDLLDPKIEKIMEKGECEGFKASQ